MEKKILIISYHFPPSRAVGGTRIANIVRYLPEYGWIPSVLTIEDKYISDPDEERLKVLKNITIYKTVKLPRLGGVYQIIKAMIVRTVGDDIGGVSDLRTSVKKNRPNINNTETLFQRLKRYFITLFLALPDTERNWIIPAALKAIIEVRRQKIKYIFTSSPPHSVHLIGLIVNFVTGVNWIADFRDPWYSGSLKESYEKRIGTYQVCSLSKKIEHWMERMVISKSKLVVCNTEQMLIRLSNAYHNMPSNKFIHIPNGISPDLFQESIGIDKYSKFTMTYIGSLYFFRSPEPIFKAVRELIDEGTIHSDDIQINLVGNCQTIDDVYSTENLVSFYGLEGIVRILPPVTHKKAIETVMKSHLALLFAPEQPFQIPAKLYEYMGSGVKILALAGDGATKDMIQSTKTGKVLRPEEHDEIKRNLAEEILRRGNTKVAIRNDILKMFDRKKLVKDLSRFMALRFHH